MNRQYFVVELLHSSHGRFKRIQISYKSLGVFCCIFVGVAVLVLGLFSSYLQMAWKVSHYNQLSANFERLRNRYQDLQRDSRQHNDQLASLETLAGEVSVAYGLNEPQVRSRSGANEANTPGAPGVKESIAQYNFLKAANFDSIYHHYAFRWQSHAQPSLWPVNGVLSSSFGGRSDPFSGEGVFHTGVDLVAAPGTPVHATADGVIDSAAWAGDYGKLIVVDHGNGLQTYYAHLSRLLVAPGQEVLRGQVIGLSGETGRVTGPHMHYEVRVRGTPVNPYKYLAQSRAAASAKTIHNDLGL